MAMAFPVIVKMAAFYQLTESCGGPPALSNKGLQPEKKLLPELDHAGWCEKFSLQPILSLVPTLLSHSFPPSSLCPPFLGSPPPIPSFPPLFSSICLPLHLPSPPSAFPSICLPLHLHSSLLPLLLTSLHPLSSLSHFHFFPLPSSTPPPPVYSTNSVNIDCSSLN